MAEEKKDFPKINRNQKKEEVKEEQVEAEEPQEIELTFGEKLIALGELMRMNANEILKFDSTDQFDNQYVDTHQYKRLLGMMCDEVKLGFAINITNNELTIEHDNKGVMIFIINATYDVEFFDKDLGVQYYTTSGLGISRGSAYASTIAETNALRNFIMNNFLLMGNDRDDDIKASAKVSTYLTDEKKAEKREELLEKTKTTVDYATIQYGKIIRTKIEETLKKDIPDNFKDTLEKFMKNKYDAEGNPLQLEGDSNLWIVKKKAAGAILNDLDQYAK